jgi:ribose transport system ATP-binding protein
LVVSFSVACKLVYSRPNGEAVRGFFEALAEPVAPVAEALASKSNPWPCSVEQKQPSNAAATLLRMEAISKRFGATVALDGVSLQLHAGQVLGLIGENGAGKSTLMSVLSGAHRPDGGTMELAGERYSPRGPHDSRLAGVAMIYQELNLAPDLSVEDNILLGQERSRFGMLDRRTNGRFARAALDRLGHGDLPLHIPVRQLSVGMKQVVEIARALVSQAKVIVFDEPTSSLARTDIERLFQTIDRLKQEGLGIVYISHFLDEIRRVCDSYLVLRDGKSVSSGQLAGTTEAEIVSLMVGRGIDELYPKVAHTPGDVLLSVQNLTGTIKPHDVSFDLRRGEILGLAGLVGAGRTELARSIFALEPIRSGSVRIGTSLLRNTPKARIQAGLGFVSENRKEEGLALGRSIADNITYSRLQPYSCAGWLNLRERRRAVNRWMQQLEIKADSPDSAIESLSGGNQQKVALARVLHQRADVLLLDEPTRGIDVGTKAIIYRLMGELAAAGQAILFVSSYFQELLHVCDRIGVMSRGRLREIRPAENWSEESLLARAIESN